MNSIKSKEMDMLNNGLAGKLFPFALPLAFSCILQKIFNSANVAVVGRFAGYNVTSQNYGAGNIKRCKKKFRQCMLFGFVFTEILSIIFIVLGDFFVSIYTTSEFEPQLNIQ